MKKDSLDFAKRIAELEAEVKTQSEWNKTLLKILQDRTDDRDKLRTENARLRKKLDGKSKCGPRTV